MRKIILCAAILLKTNVNAQFSPPPLPPPQSSFPQDWGQTSTGYYPNVRNNFATKPGWDLVFSDEFNGSGVIDNTKWNTGYGYWDAINFSNPSDPNIAYQSNGTLKLNLKYTPNTTYIDPFAGPVVRDFLGTTFKTWANNFGPGKYYEIRCKLPNGALNHPGFFVFSRNSATHWSEIDFYENGTCDATGLAHIGTNYHKGIANPSCQNSCPASNSAINPVFNYNPCDNGFGGECVSDHGFLNGNYGTPFNNSANASQEFYTVGVEWNSNEILWYLNHKLIRRTTTDIPIAPGEIWLGNLADMYVYAAFQNNNTPISQLVGTMEVDYVRVYSKNLEISNPLNDFCVAQGGNNNNERPRILGDVNGDGKKDIVCFGWNFTLISLATSSGFSSPYYVLQNFTKEQGWNSQSQYPRYLADVNGDGKDDIIGFGYSGTYVSLSNCSGSFAQFTPPALVINDFGAQQLGNSNDLRPRYMADVNGDGKKDIISFGVNYTSVCLSTTPININYNTIPTFTGKANVIANFTAEQGWNSNEVRPRLVGDINGDGKDDIVAFGYNTTYVSLSTSNGLIASYNSPHPLFNFYTCEQGWTNQNERPRFLADINGDGKKDIVGFGSRYVKGSISQTALNVNSSTIPSFIAESNYIENFTVEQGWTNMNEYPRFVENVDCESRCEIIGLGHTDVLISKPVFGNSNPLYGNTYVSFDSPSIISFKEFTNWEGWNSQNIYPRFLADINGDGSKEILGFGYSNVRTLKFNGSCSMQNKLTNNNEFEEFSIDGQESMGNFKIFPNPNNGKFVIENNTKDRLNYSIIDLQGRVIEVHSLDEEKAEIDLSNYDKGIYFIKCTVNGKTEQKKIIVQ